MNAENRSRPRQRRDVLKRRRRERQILVFGLLAIVLAFVGFAASAVYRGDVESPFSAPIYTPPSEFESEIRLACPPPNTYPVSEAEVPVRVFNGGEVQGLAGSVSGTLEGRNFVIVSVGNAARSYSGHARISYGTEGLVRAYTLARHFETVEMVLDTRDNGVIDLTLGEDFNTSQIRPLLSAELQGEDILAPYAQCLPMNLIPAELAPRNVPDDPLAPEPSPSPSATPSVEPEDGE